MKKLLCAVLCMMLLALPALAESDPDGKLAELEAQIADLLAQNAALTQQIEELTATPAPTPEPTPTPVPQFETLQKGSKGEAVTKLQERLKELGYLGGKADGSFGGQSESAVKEFQKTAGLDETGIADPATQELLFSAAAPQSPNPILDDSLYEKLDYKSCERDPEAYKGKLIKFTGKVLQVIEGEGYADFRIASKGNYDNVVYVSYLTPEGYKRILEDDKVTVYATSTGIYSYETVRGDVVTIPSCFATRIELN